MLPVTDAGPLWQNAGGRHLLSLGLSLSLSNVFLGLPPSIPRSPSPKMDKRNANPRPPRHDDDNETNESPHHTHTHTHTLGKTRCGSLGARTTPLPHTPSFSLHLIDYLTDPTERFVLYIRPSHNPHIITTYDGTTRWHRHLTDRSNQTKPNEATRRAEGGLILRIPTFSQKRV